MAKVIVIFNQKGGVGKTTTTLNMGYALAELGKKVLLVDFDPQGSLTVCYGYDDTDSITTTIGSLMSMAIEDRALPSKEDYIIRAGNVDFIASNLELSAIEVGIVNAMSRESVLKSILDEIKEDYDYVIVDCSPSLGMLSINALVACDSVVIPVTPQFLSAKGLELLLQNIVRVKKKLNSRISVEGILLTMFDERTTLTKEVYTKIQNAYGNSIRIFETKIPYSVGVGKGNLKSMSTIEFDPKNKVSEAYVQFAKEALR